MSAATFVKNLDGRQHSDWLYVTLTLANFVANANVIEGEVAPGSELVGGFVNVVTAFDGGTTDTVAVGDPTTPARYLAATTIKAAGRTPLVPTGFIYGRNGSTQKFRVTRATTGTAATVGELRVAMEFVQDGKWYLTQG